MSNRLFDSVLNLDGGPRSVNFYRDDSDSPNAFATTAAERRGNLRRHLDDVSDGDIVLVGEAAGWMGARQSGVAFTSAPDFGLLGDREASATVVQRVLEALDLTGRALLWNAFPLHPHDNGNPRSNRTPLASELRSGEESLALAVHGRRIICVGQQAARSVGKLLNCAVPSVWNAPRADAVAIRHPSYGGGPDFTAGLRAAVL